jgi:hypothetical protein
MLNVVTKQGIYRHEIVGIYEDLMTAIGIARQSMQKEPDDYHEFHVSRCWVDTQIDDVKTYIRVSRHNKKVIMEFADDLEN